MKSTIYTILLFLFYLTNSTQAQINYTANDIVPTYNAPFGFGINLGWHKGWTDEQLADIAVGNPELGIEGVGINTLRPALPDFFLEQWGYDIRVKTFQSHVQKGATENVVFIGYPSEAHRSQEEHCPGIRSEMFANIYEPIWDNGANGTPYNEENYYAAYVHEMVSRYGEYIRFYEVWNEPDFPKVSFLVQNREDPRNWWDNNPNPCDYELRAPIFHYIRLLRITYEVVKTLDPDSYVAVGGLGKTAFLDAILRNTDNPKEGEITENYPLKGGAYFDVLSFHSYPHIDGSLRTWNNARRAFDYDRHSDAAVDGMLRLRQEFEDVLFDYSYDGKTFPEKEWLLTETNLPRIAVEDRIGSSEAQVNYLMKCMVEAQRANILQVHPYKLGDTDRFAGNSEFDPMGLYDNLENHPPYTATANDAGIAYKTLSDALHNHTFDATQTEKMNLPKTIRGAAFKNIDGQYTYIVWVRTSIDQSEQAAATLDLSALLNSNVLIGKKWNYSITSKHFEIAANQITLTASPLILVEEEDNNGVEDDPNLPDDLFTALPNPFTDQLTLKIRLTEAAQVNASIVNGIGTVVVEVVNINLAAGTYEYIINSSNWANDIYHLRAQIGNKEFLMPLVRMRN
ncbi:MAG: hypothetical protein AAGG68_23135 [Bacteroidota bacterium]